MFNILRDIQKKSSRRKFAKNASGNVAMITALAIVPIMGVFGLAVDLQLVVTKKNTVQQTLDATMIAAARERQSGATEAELNIYVNDYFNSLLRANDNSVVCLGDDPNSNRARISLTLADDSEDMSGSVSCEQATTLSAIFGLDQFEFDVTSGASFGIGDVEVAFVFDLSGSMNCPEDLQVGFSSACTGNNSNIRTRMDALQEAATAAVDTLLETNNRPGSSIRISMVGYTNAVNAGEFFDDVLEIPTGGDRRSSNLENSEQLGSIYDDQIVGKVQVENGSNLQFFDYERIRCPGGTSSNLTNCFGNYQDFAGRFYYPVGQEPTCVWPRQGIEAATDAPPNGNNELRAARPVWNYSSNFNHNDDTNFNRKRIGQDEIQRQLGRYRFGGPQAADVTNTSIPSNEVFSTTGSINANDARCNQDVQPQPLTANESDLLDFIGSMEPNGGTAGHAGIAWGWYMLSPKWANIWPSQSEPAAYFKPETAKVLILMTDGEFINTAPGATDSSVSQAAALCESIKDTTNISIFTVKLGAFASSETVQGQSITDFCATSADLSLNPTNGDQLVDDFKQIAAQISDLRISN